jgi:hypothetical protein
LETKSISRLLSLLELGGQTGLVRIYPAGEPSANGASSGASGWSLGGSSPSSSDASWHAELYMQAGQLQQSVVFNAAGDRKLMGDQALNFLGQMGGLSYELLPLPTRPGLPPPGSVTSPLPPHPQGYAGAPAPREPYDAPQPGEVSWFSARPVSPANFWRPARTKWGELVAHNPQRLTRDQRRVLGLINGQRSVSELSRLLGFSAEALSEVLAFFQEQNLIS